MDFYPRPPRGGRLTGWSIYLKLRKFLSTPSARRATYRVRCVNSSGAIFLSTPSARRATWPPRRPPRIRSDFYPRPPRGGRLTPNRCPSSDVMKFLSTPSARRATVLDLQIPRCEEISIHALREEGDRRHPPKRRHQTNFYPRPPRGGRPSPTPKSNSQASNFYPRPPRGGRRVGAKGDVAYSEFLSTPSARRATPHLHRHREPR